MAIPEGNKKSKRKYQKEKTTTLSVNFVNKSNVDLTESINGYESKSNTIFSLMQYNMYRKNRKLVIDCVEISVSNIGKHREEIEYAESRIRSKLEPSVFSECEECFETGTPFHIILMEYLYRAFEDIIV